MSKPPTSDQSRRLWVWIPRIVLPSYALYAIVTQSIWLPKRYPGPAYHLTGRNAVLAGFALMIGYGSLVASTIAKEQGYSRSVTLSLRFFGLAMAAVLAILAITSSGAS